jgi:hypothetical protein
MKGVRRAQFQEAAVRHIVSRFRDPSGSKRVLLADEVGLGKTVVARGVIERLMERRRNPLTVVYLCSNTEIAEQNRTKLDPDSAAPVGRVTELAFKAKTPDTDLRLYSFTPGTSLKDGMGLKWERRLLMYLLHRAFGFPVWRRAWQEFFRCGVQQRRNWNAETTRRALNADFERKTTRTLQTSLKAAWRKPIDGRPAKAAIHDAVAQFDPSDAESRSSRNRLVAQLRGVMQKVVLRCLEPDLLILDEVQRFRDVIDESENREHIAAELFARRMPVLILSATPYRALTLGHELSEGVTSHHEDFFKTLEFLFDRDRETPAAIRENLRAFGDRLRAPSIATTLDHDLLALKHRLEDDLKKVICRTERNWYVMDRRKGIDDTAVASGSMPGRPELEEFFRLHDALGPLQAAGQVTEFWKSAPSLLTFMDGRYALLKRMKEEQFLVPRELLTTGPAVGALVSRNHRISKVSAVALGTDEAPPHLWTPPTYRYYRDDGFFGEASVRKVLVFSGWRFVPKAVAVITSQIVTNRLGGIDESPTQPLRFASDRLAFHPLDICFPSLALAETGDEAYRWVVKRAGNATAEDVLAETASVLRRRLDDHGVSIVSGQGDPIWRVVMRLEGTLRGRAEVEAMLDAWEEAAAASEGSHAIGLHRQQLSEWLDDESTTVRLAEGRVRRLALIAAFSPACCLLRAVQSVFPDEALGAYLPRAADVALGALRRYFNKAHVQKIIRNHQFRMPWRSAAVDDDRGYTERVLVYAADGQFQAVIDEYVYLLRHAAQADSAEKALDKLEAVWGLARGTPRTNGPKGTGRRVRINADAESHATHFALAFGDDVARESSPDADEEEVKQRKSVIREAFNSPFWPFVLATTSVGQEGLDFHLYCRDILHWNLPSNPVDLEQREGRINRRDCLAVRQSIARDWALADVTDAGSGSKRVRNPWTAVFDAIVSSENPQKYKHGLFPHWVYECHDPQATVRIQRHVPFFATSRDALRYERLKAGLALYRLVFGQVNQQDLLEDLHAQIEALPQDEQERAFRRLASYMLNLSPVSHEEAIAHAAEEAGDILSGKAGVDCGERLLDAVEQLRSDRDVELSAVSAELNGLTEVVRRFLRDGGVPSDAVRTAATALAYLRNPYDRIFDLHVEGGLSDDIDVIREAWAALTAQSEALGA